MMKNKKRQAGFHIFIGFIIAVSLMGTIVVGTGIFNDLRSRSKTLKLGFQDVGELVTQVVNYTSVDVIDDPRTVFGVAVPGTTSKCIYSYDGIIKAGIRNCMDIQQVEYPDRNLIILQIPDVEILSNNLIDDSLEIYDETKNIFNPLSMGDFNESKNDLKMRSEQDAIDNGILDSARLNAENMLKSFVSAFEDLKEYEVQCEWIVEE